MTSDPFYYGVRRKVSADVHGQPLYDETPLQPEDFLNPTADDIFELGPTHAQDVAKLLRVFQVHYRHNQLTIVLESTKIRWANDSLDQPRPDIIIATTDTPQMRHDRIFDVVTWGAAPRCIIEVVSPRFVEADLETKVGIYAQGGVQEYFIIDSGWREDSEVVFYAVYGYQLEATHYQPIAPDDQGMLQSQINRVRIGPSEDRSTFVVIDERTNQPIEAQDIQGKERIAEVQGNRRASDIGSALDFLRG